MAESIDSVRYGGITVVTKTTNLVPAAGEFVYYYWYLDGQFLQQTVSNFNSFMLPPGNQARVEVIDSLDGNLDGLANAPVAYSTRRTISWVRSIDPLALSYRVEQKISGGPWVAIGHIVPLSQQWTMSVITPALKDLTSYQWQIIPIDKLGNDGTAIAIASEKIVRLPDAPVFTATFDNTNQRVNFKAVA